MMNSELLERYRTARNLLNSTANQQETLYHKRQRITLENLRRISYKQSKNRRYTTYRSTVRLSTDIRREFQVDKQNQPISSLSNIENRKISVPLRIYPQPVQIRSILSKTSIDKSIFNCTRILGQFDRKFLIGKHIISSSSSIQLILFDQHAISERIFLERLQNHFQNDHIRTVPFHLSEPTIIARNPCFLYSSEQITLLEQTGFIFTSISSQNLLIRAVPAWLLSFSQRHSSTSLLDDIISHTIDNILQQTNLPSTNIELIIYETLKSLACHNAIKFNDLLSITECSHLLNELKSCSMPFICAHGRTSTALLWQYDLPVETYQVDMIELAQQASIHKWLKES